AIDGHAALLLAPHGRSAAPAAALTAAKPPAQPSEPGAATRPQAAGLVLGQWIFRDLTAAAAG
ncbi:MAG: hypothetical protein ACFCUQ_13400, partial [Kiloniellales bacterium]